MIGTNDGGELSVNGSNIYDSYSVNKKKDANGHAYSRTESIDKE